MACRLTKVEKLDAQKPGLRQYVDLRFDAGATCEVIATEVKAKYGLDIPRPTLRVYRECRWLPARQRVQSQIEGMEAIMAYIKKYGVSNYTRAYIMEKLSESTKPPPAAVLLHEEREHERLDLDRKKLHLDAKKVRNAQEATEMRFREMKAKRDKVRKVVKQARHGQEDAQQALNHIREIYGLKETREGKG
jgi:hypothetical protein